MGRVRDMISGMKRRGFVKALVALPAAAEIAAQQPTQQQAPATPQTPVAQPPAGGRGGGGRGFGQATIPKFELTQTEAIGEPAPRFFNAQQFAALRKLSDILVPPMRNLPGALDCGAPEFLDFLIGA